MEIRFLLSLFDGRKGGGGETNPLRSRETLWFRSLACYKPQHDIPQVFFFRRREVNKILAFLTPQELESPFRPSFVFGA